MAIEWKEPTTPLRGTIKETLEELIAQTEAILHTIAIIPKSPDPSAPLNIAYTLIQDASDWIETQLNKEE